MFNPILIILCFRQTMSLYDDIDIDKKDIGDSKSDVCEFSYVAKG